MKEQHKQPSVVILATGGTIAGVGRSAEETTGYRAAVLAPQDILPREIDLSRYNITCEEFAAVDSKDIDDALWLRLTRRVNELTAASSADGIVITHGTDTMEETAYWLSLTVRTAKPVVLTGAMRPATAIGADGSRNLLSAVKLAADENAKNRGVMVAFNDCIFDAASVVKNHTTAVNAFAAKNSGAIGYFTDRAPVFYRRAEIDAPQFYFDTGELSALPYVKIIYGHAGDDALFVEAAQKAGVRGLVYAGAGNGSIHARAAEALARAADSGIAVVRCSRTAEGAVQGSEPYGEKFIVGGLLPPAKARILLALALTQTDVPSEIAEFFT